MSAIAALAWARHVGASTTFSLLPVGARFVFNADDVDKPYAVLVRTKGGYRHEIGGRQWRTGARVACYRLPDIGDAK